MGFRFSIECSRLALAMVLTLAACSRANELEGGLEPAPGPIPVNVRNENFLDVNVSVLSGGVTRRLGQVSGNGSADFKINWSVANGTSVALVANAIGSNERWTSPGLSVRPGQMIAV